MTYVEFRDAIRGELRKRAAGLTWGELRDRLGLPYERPCPEWTRRLEEEIGLVRGRGEKGPALVWRVKNVRDVAVSAAKGQSRSKGCGSSLRSE